MGRFTETKHRSFLGLSVDSISGPLGWVQNVKETRRILRFSDYRGYGGGGKMYQDDTGRDLGGVGARGLFYRQSR